MYKKEIENAKRAFYISVGTLHNQHLPSVEVQTDIAGNDIEKIEVLNHLKSKKDTVVLP